MASKASLSVLFPRKLELGAARVKDGAKRMVMNNKEQCMIEVLLGREGNVMVAMRKHNGM